MSLSWQRTSGIAIGRTRMRASAFAVAQSARFVGFAAVVGALFWVVWIYGNGLRDPRYLDGWILTAGFLAQLCFHVAIKSRSLSPRWSMRWRKFHIYLGYILVAAFVSHTDFSLPDTTLEWALWLGFVLISISGLCGVYLSWSLKTSGRIDVGLTFSSLPARRSDLARQVHALATDSDQAEPLLALPGLPHDAWIADLYAQHLKAFFAEPRNVLSHLIGSRRPMNLLMTEVDGLSRYLDHQSNEKLATIRALVIAKDDLDFARVHLWLNQAWLFVHVPITYALSVLAIFHGVVVYAFSSGAW